MKFVGGQNAQIKMVFKSIPRLTCLPVSDILYINTVFCGKISGKAFIEYLFQNVMYPENGHNDEFESAQ